MICVKVKVYVSSEGYMPAFPPKEATLSTSRNGRRMPDETTRDSHGSDVLGPHSLPVGLHRGFHQE